MDSGTLEKFCQRILCLSHEVRSNFMKTIELLHHCTNTLQQYIAYFYHIESIKYILQKIDSYMIRTCKFWELLVTEFYNLTSTRAEARKLKYTLTGYLLALCQEKVGSTFYFCLYLFTCKAKMFLAAAAIGP